MIRYALACEAGHTFESWFPSSHSYDDQVARGLVTCPVCETARVSKAVMAPRLARTDKGEPAPAPPAQPVPMVAEPARQMRALLRAVSEHVMATSEPVGDRFPKEARKIHYGESAERSIYGQASPDEARALIEEGINVAALPLLPDDRN